MILIGTKLNFRFKTKEKITKNVFQCGLNDKFNIVLHTEYTGIIGNACDDVCFIVPVHYPSFIFTFDKKVSLEKSVDKFFEFDSQRERSIFCKYVSSLENRNVEKIKFLR